MVRLALTHDWSERKRRAAVVRTWRATDDRQFVCVWRDQPAVKVTLDGERFRTVLVGLDDADGVATDIRAATHR